MEMMEQEVDELLFDELDEENEMLLCLIAEVNNTFLF
jgi:hypothetical protein